MSWDDLNITCDRVAELTGGINCFTQYTWTSNEKHVPYCDQFKDGCAAKCTAGYSVGDDEQWTMCMLYSLQLHNWRPVAYDPLIGSLIDSPSRDNLGPPWKDTELATCLTELCHQSSSTCQSSCLTKELLINETLLNIDAARTCQIAICSEGTINPDIAGIGVYISLILQLSLVFLLVILWCVAGLSALIVSSNRKPRTSQERRRGYCVEGPSLIENIHPEIFKIAVNFHKAQIVFAMTLSITSTYVLYSNINIVTDIDQRALTIVVGSGIYPPTIMLFFLVIAGAHKISIFTLGISLITWIWSIFISRRAIGSTVTIRPLQEPNASCGEMTLPQFCNRTQLQYKTAEYFSTIIPMVATLLLWVILHRLYQKLIGDSLGAPMNKEDSPEPTRLATRSDRGNRSEAFLGIFLSLFVIGSIVAFSICLGNWTKYLVKTLRGSLSPDWSFGQIMALMLWLPTIFEGLEQCCYLLHCLITLFLALCLRQMIVFGRRLKLLNVRKYPVPSFDVDFRQAILNLASLYRNWRASPRQQDHEK